MDLHEKLEHLPLEPGVYIMKNSAGTVIYVGKAKRLKNRVSQYFMNLKSHTPKVLAMVRNIADFEYIVTDNETEALVLECNLIKKYRPHYNILLKDDKQYPFIKVSMKQDYPTIQLARKVATDNARYFGPYVSTFAVRQTIQTVQRIFRIAHCRKQFPRDIGKERPCLYHSIGQCVAPCQGKISSEEYHALFEEICEFLDGKYHDLVRRLKEQMETASKQLEFELAAALRDKINSIHAVMEKQKIVSQSRGDVDVIALARGINDAVVDMLFIRKGNLIENEHFVISDCGDVDEVQIINDFVKQYYAQGALIPNEIILPCEMEESDVIEEWLSEKKARRVHFKVPQRGQDKRILEMAEKNANEQLEKHRLEEEKNDRSLKLLALLQSELSLPSMPRRMEAYDISNISGSDNVGAMVVFTDGKPEPSKYRKFKIKSVSGANDYESMREMLYRRFTHERKHPEEDTFAEMPDLLLIDGGKGHVHAAEDVLSELHLSIPVFGMVKDDKHQTRALVSPDGEIALTPTGAIYRLFALIQDEVHRSAISYHRSLRAKKMTGSITLDIKGIGKARSKALFQHFHSFNKIKQASIEELSQVKGISASQAETIYAYFHKNLE